METTANAVGRVPWNKGKIVGQKAPFKLSHRVITRHLLGQAGLKADEVDSGAVTMIQRFDSATNLNVDLHFLVLDGWLVGGAALQVVVADGAFGAMARSAPATVGRAGKGRREVVIVVVYCGGIDAQVSVAEGAWGQLQVFSG